MSLLLIVLLSILCGLPVPARAALHSVELRIPGVAQSIHLAPADADAFQRRLSAPPAYAGPLPSGESVTVTTDYWDSAVGAGAGGPPTDAPGAYFPAAGVVKLRQYDRDAYFVLDQRQRANLDRYIRLAQGGLIGPKPGALQVLAAASGSESISIDMGGTPLDAAMAHLVWAALNGRPEVSFIDEPQLPAKAAGLWLTFTTAEGKSLGYHYDSAAHTLTDALETERYTIPAGLPLDPQEARQVAQQQPVGSLLWWPIMLGGGAALIAAAIWFRRHDT